MTQLTSIANAFMKFEIQQDKRQCNKFQWDDIQNLKWGIESVVSVYTALFPGMM